MFEFERHSSALGLGPSFPVFFKAVEEHEGLRTLTVEKLTTRRRWLFFAGAVALAKAKHYSIRYERQTVHQWAHHRLNFIIVAAVVRKLTTHCIVFLRQYRCLARAHSRCESSGTGCFAFHVGDGRVSWLCCHYAQNQNSTLSGCQESCSTWGVSNYISILIIFYSIPCSIEFVNNAHISCAWLTAYLVTVMRNVDRADPDRQVWTGWLL